MQARCAASRPASSFPDSAGGKRPNQSGPTTALALEGVRLTTALDVAGPMQTDARTSCH